MIYITFLALVAVGVAIACVLEYRRTKKKWESYEKEVKYDFTGV
jgi:heme/copper-type cytochrome/quinol oxidase subunit 2